MGTESGKKLQKLLDLHKPGSALLASWLESRDISYDLQRRYRKSGWLESLGRGAFKRPKNEVSWQGALHALQSQAGLKVHTGGVTALPLQGLAHYVRLQRETVYLFSPPGITLPSWFRRHDWGVLISHVRTSFLPSDLGLTCQKQEASTIRMSCPERAILECLYLVPNRFDLMECHQLMTGLVNLRPGVVQELLEACRSIKVKRLFLYLADKAGHQWFKFLDREKLDLGKGDRTIVKGGVYVADFGIVIPEELARA